MKLFLLLMMTMCSFSYAGIRDVGNAGGGVVVNGKVHLLDLYEAGVTAASIDQSVTPYHKYSDRLASLQVLADDEKLLLAQKLTELRAYSPKMADLITLGIDKYVWRVLDNSFIDIPEVSPIDLSKLQLVPLANRWGGTIRINKKYWDLMDKGHKVALIVHEILYAFEIPVEITKGVFEQRSGPVRERVGYMFSPEFKSRGQQGFSDFMGIEKRASEILSNNSLEVGVENISLIFSEDFRPLLQLGNVEKSIDVFCASVERKMFKSRVKILSGAAIYSSFEATISMQDYQAGSGPQKWLQVTDSPFILNNYHLEDAKFYPNDRSTCVNWVQSKRSFVLSLPSFSVLPQIKPGI